MKKYSTHSIFGLGILVLACLLQINALTAQNCSVNANVAQTFCPDDAITLLGSAGGLYNPSTILWTQVGGPAVIIDNPTSFTSNITGVTGGNNYTFRLFVTCQDSSRVFQDVVYTVLPQTPANAGSDITGCPGTYSLSANAPMPGEFATWSIVGNNNGVTITDPFSPTSSITLAPGNGGQTTLRWLITNINGCFTTDDIIVTNCGGVSPVDAGANQILGNCFSLTTMTTMAATPAGFCGIGLWMVVSGPNVPNIASPGAHNSQITNLMEGTYVFRWVVEGDCASGEDLVTVTVPPPTADVTPAEVTSGSQTFCDGRSSAVLQGTIPLYTNETVTWTQTAGPPATIVSPNTPVTNVTGLDGVSTYSFSYTILNLVTNCSSSGSVTLQFGMNSVVTVPVEELLLICDQTSATITYTDSGPGAVQWRILSGPAEISTPFVNAGASPFTITDLIVAGTYIIELRKNTPVGASCMAISDQVRVIVSREVAQSNAGTDQLLPCNIYQTVLAGNTPFIGIGTWTQVSGPNTAMLSDIHAPNAIASGLIRGSYIFRWIISGGPICVQAEDDVLIRVSDIVPTSAMAGADQMVCNSTPVYLSANPAPLSDIGTWTVSPSAGVVFSDIHDPYAVVTGLAANTVYTFTWTKMNSCTSASDDVVVTTNNTPGPDVADAGPDQCLPAGTTSITMAGNNPTVGTGLWTKFSGPAASIVSPARYNTVINGLTNGTYVFIWSNLNSGCTPTTDTVVVTISATVSAANAGADQNICGVSATLAGNAPSVGTGNWIQAGGPGGTVITAPNSHVSTITGLTNGVYSFVWTITNGACVSTPDTVMLFVSLPPAAAMAGPDQTICGGTSATLAANAVANGYWTLVSGPNTPFFFNPLSPTSMVSGLVFGTYILQWNSISGPFCPAETDQVQLTVYPTANAGADQTYCEEVMTVSLIGSVASTGVWTQVSGAPVTVTTTSANSATASGLTPGVYVFQYEINEPGCNTTDQMTVTLSAPPTIANAGDDQVWCEATSFTLSGNTPVMGVGAWSILAAPGGGTFSPNANTPNATFAPTPGNYGVYLFSWEIANGTCSNRDQVRVTNYQNPTPANAGMDINAVCTDQVTMAGNDPAVGVGEWTQISGPSVAVIASPILYNTVISNLVAGIYTFRWTPKTDRNVPPPSMRLMSRLKFNRHRPTRGQTSNCATKVRSILLRHRSW